MIPAIPSGDVHDLFLGLLVAVVAPIDMKARAIEMGKVGRKAQTLGRGSGYEAVEFRDPIVVERIQSPPKRVIVEMAGLHSWRDESRDGFVLKKMRDKIELLVDKAQAVEDHRLDCMACGHKTHFRVLPGGLVNDLGDAEFFTHARNKAQVI